MSIDAVSELGIGANATDPVTPMPPMTDPTTEPTWEETHADWMRFYAAEKAGLIDPERQHTNQWVAFYDGRVVGYGDAGTPLQKRVAAELGVHWARVVVDYLGMW